MGDLRNGFQAWLLALARLKRAGRRSPQANELRDGLDRAYHDHLCPAVLAYEESSADEDDRKAWAWLKSNEEVADPLP
jgi:hypothetical protein